MAMARLPSHVNMIGTAAMPNSQLVTVRGRPRSPRAGGRP